MHIIVSVGFKGREKKATDISLYIYLMTNKIKSDPQTYYWEYSLVQISFPLVTIF